MKTIPVGLLTAYRSGSSSLAMCWKLSLTNGSIYGFTESDAPLIVDGLTYLAASGFSPSAFENQTKLAVDNADAIGILDNDVITETDLVAGVWDYADVEVFRVSRDNIAAGKDIIAKGKLGQVSLQRTTFRAELRGMANAYAQSVGDIYQPGCRAIFGDSKCGVDLTPYTVTGTLESVSASGLVLFDSARTEAGPVGAKTITAISKATNAVVTSASHGIAAGSIVYIAGVVGPTKINGNYYEVLTVALNTFTINFNSLNEPDYVSGGKASLRGDAGYFAYGKITMTSGASDGLSMEVKAFDTGTITLQLELPLGVAAGDTYTMHAGCGKRWAEDCFTRFDNAINFRGEPFVPGNDKLIQFGGQT